MLINDNTLEDRVSGLERTVKIQAGKIRELESEAKILRDENERLAFKIHGMNFKFTVGRILDRMFPSIEKT